MNEEVITNKNKDIHLFYHDQCDKYDYLLSVACGAVAGIIDIFLVGTPEESILGQWTDKQVDDVVVRFARKVGWKPREGKENSIASAIHYLEEFSRGHINYDQRHSSDVNNLFKMSPKNHHLKSLAHSPDIIGLFFSLLNQFTGTSTFADNGKLITLKADTVELYGGNQISKIYCGFCNWVIHLMSDVAGSSGTRGNGGRGSGLAIPFYELLQFCDIGKLQVDQYRNSVATVATKVFEQGYDTRMGLAMTMPMLFCNLSIKLVWALKRFFYHRKPICECIPTSQHDDLRIMLIVGDGTMCAIDAIDAGVRSGGNAVTFLLRINFVGWCKFASLVFKEIIIRTGTALPLEVQQEYYQKMKEALANYYGELEKTDVQRYRIIVSDFSCFVDEVRTMDDEVKINTYLYEIHEKFEIPLPYQSDFEAVMKKNLAIRFE